MIADIVVVPQIEGSGREVVAGAVAEIAGRGLRFDVGAAGTTVEGELGTILDAVQAIEARLRADGVQRAVIELRLQMEPHPETLEHQVEGIAAVPGALS
jgi:uncharacterized protein YqgV (UPF0045/DUF77 family)